MTTKAKKMINKYNDIDYLKSPYGYRGSIKELENGMFRLIMRSPNGKLLCNKNYLFRRSALNAWNARMNVLEKKLKENNK